MKKNEKKTKKPPPTANKTFPAKAATEIKSSPPERARQRVEEARKAAFNKVVSKDSE